VNRFGRWPEIGGSQCLRMRRLPDDFPALVARLRGADEVLCAALNGRHQSGHPINLATPPPRHRGNPLCRKGIPSPNAAGRPPAGLSLANAIRRKFSPAFICELAAGFSPIPRRPSPSGSRPSS
jgi:hypothetical protein